VTPTARLALAVLLAAPATARAQDDLEREARQRFERGVELTDSGQFNGAMVEFSRAYELTRNPQLLYNVAVTHEALGHFVEALATLDRYLAEAPPAVIQRRRADIDAALGRLRARVGTLAVALDHPGLTLRIDGVERPIARARAGLVVDAGRHRVALSAPGLEPREQDHDVAGGQTVVIREPLARRRSTLAIDCDVPGAEVLVDGVVVATTPVLSPIPVDEGTRRVELRRLGYTPYSTVVDAVGSGARVQPALAWGVQLPDRIAAHLVVAANEPNVVASVDGQRVRPDGADPIPPGFHRLRVERQGFFPAEQTVDLPPGVRSTVRVTLLPTPAHRTEYLNTARLAHLASYAAIGVGAGLLAAGVAGVVYTSAELAAYTEEFRVNDLRQIQCATGDTSCAPREATTLRDRNDYIQSTLTVRYDAARIAGVVVGGLGLVGMVTGFVLLARAPSLRRFAASPAIAPGPGGLVITF
jgi:hypothetical protein